MKRCLAMLLMVLATPAIGRAERHVLPVGEVRPITSPEAAGRILLDFDSVAELGDVVVSSAYIEIPLPDVVPARDLELAVYPMARSWRGQSATWTTPWDEPGGDLDESYVEEVTLHKGTRPGSLRLNVTQAVQWVVMEGAPWRGFLLTVPLRRAEGFTEAQRTVLGAMTGARLVVTTANGKAARLRDSG